MRGESPEDEYFQLATKSFSLQEKVAQSAG